ncbi:hypothetical protein SUGI_0760050 [Cryptomeria japonica]|nr:hypothetical protein SUGI_0760050 [Cryptomeria japonica]
MVANCMIASIARNASQLGLSFYHVASSNMNPLKYNVIVDASYNYFSAHPCTSRNGRIVRVKKLRPLESMFDISNMEDLWNKMSERDQENFNFHVKRIDWKRYFINCHIPGLVKYVMRG